MGSQADFKAPCQETEDLRLESVASQLMQAIEEQNVRLWKIEDRIRELERVRTREFEAELARRLQLGDQGNIGGMAESWSAPLDKLRQSLRR
jgi:RPA family protein